MSRGADARDASALPVLRAAIHDLKAAAGRIRVLTDLLTIRVSSADEQTRDLVHRIGLSHAELNETVDALRRYSEIVGHERFTQPIDLNSVLESVRTRLRAEIEACNACIESDPLPKVEADGLQIGWVLEELFRNALRFRHQRRLLIHVTARRESDSWRLSVRDSGSGVAPEIAARMFLPFKRGSSESGAGIGLTTCQAIIEAHGGKIWFEPRSEGAEVVFTIPCGSRSTS